MNITYNNLSNPENTISFTGFPNIVKIYEANNGSKCKVSILINNLSLVTLGTEYTIEIGGQKIVSTNDIATAKGNKFYITNDNTEKNRIAVANSIVQALRSLTTVPINFFIFLNTDNNGNISARVEIEAKEVGKTYNIEVSGSLFSTNIASRIIQLGTTSSQLLQGTDNKIIIDVYKNKSLNDKPQSSTFYKGDYLTTLTKECNGNETYFDITPLITSLAEYGEVSKLNLYIYLQTDNNITFLQLLKNIYFTTGYSVNQGVPFIQPFTNLFLAQNVSRGTTKGFYNNTTLYTYEPHITLSLYAEGSILANVATIEYINSARETFFTQTIPFSISGTLGDIELDLDTTNFNKAFFVDVTIPNVGKLRYNVIKPINATDEIQRVYWTNSYGGTSFFDFTGTRTETRKTKVDYYQKNLFNYYDKDTAELNKVYDKNVNITVSLSSHNIEKNGTWQFFDLQNSTNAWTIVNNKKYYITITDLKITESNVNDIYVATVEYEYSMGDTF